MEALNGWDNDIFLLHISGPVAQWLEQGTHNPLVAGSNPAGPTHCMRNPRGESIHALTLSSDGVFVYEKGFARMMLGSEFLKIY